MLAVVNPVYLSDPESEWPDWIDDVLDYDEDIDENTDDE